MNNLPDSYPYLEPCPGCFEDSLRALSERPGSPIFFSNGDFTLERLLTAFSKLASGGYLLLCTYRLEKKTVEYVRMLMEKGLFETVLVFCTINASDIDIDMCGKLCIIQCGMNAFIVQVYNERRSFTLSGLFMQGVCSYGLEMFVMHNNLDEQLLIRNTLFSKFRKQLNAYVKR